MQTTDWHGCYRQGWGELMANPDAFAHPAKNSRNLARRIYEHAFERGYFQRGQTVLDPFAGVGGFAFHAMRFGMHFVGVELEQRFVDYASGYDCPGFGKAFFRRFWHRLDRLNYKLFHLCPACVRALKADDFGGVMPSQGAHRYQGNIELWNERYAAHFPRWGSAVIVQGDSRRLGEVLVGRVSGMVDSPPYAESLANCIHGIDTSKGWLAKHRPNQAGKRGPHLQRYVSYNADDPNNLGNLPAGELDAVLVTSPPFEQVEGFHDKDFSDKWGPKQSRTTQPTSYGTTPGQLAALPPGTVNAALTSPPYAASTASDDPDRRGGLFRDPKRRTDKTLTATYGESEGQLGGMAGGDYKNCISSPPFCSSDSRGAAKMPDDYFVRADGTSFGEGRATRAVLDSPDNLGNQSRDTFWTAAKQIVQQLRQVLAPGAYAIFVTKRFVRDKKIVEFSEQWMKLCEACGFELVEWIRAWLVEERGTQLGLWGDDENKDVRRVSFFRRLHSQKYPHLSIDWEDVLIFRRINMINTLHCDWCGSKAPMLLWVESNRGPIHVCKRCWDEDRVTPPSLPCGNCGTYRTVDRHFEVEDCPNCGDDEFSLCGESGM